METVAVTKNVPKDAKEVIDVITNIISHFLQKKPFSELLGELPAVMGAVNGWENIVPAVKGGGLGEITGYAVGELVELFERPSATILHPPKPAPVEEPQA